MDNSDKAIWILLSRYLKSWEEVLVIVKPITIIKWHRKGFKLYWRWKIGRRAQGRNKIDREIIKLIKQMSIANPLWGAPRIHGELLKIDIEVSESTVQRYMVKPKKPPSQIYRTHQSLEKDCPEYREVELSELGNIKSKPILGGLHHRYYREAA